MAKKKLPPHSIVVGGARGLGRTLVDVLAREGHRVSVLDCLEPLPGEPAAPGTVFRRVDILDGPAVAAALSAIRRSHGPPRNAVFLQRYRGTDDPWTGEIATSLSATRRIIEELADHFPAKSDNAIVVVGSAADTYVAEEQPAGYHAAKAALRQLVRYYAVLLGPRGVRCNAVAPAIFQKQGARRPPGSRALAAVTPLRRIPAAEEIARVILFLCSPAAACLTGQSLVVDAGLSLIAHASLVRQLASPVDRRNPGGQ
jgi:NAD(P)-dependent dehydrogenase (short-subunit alcohol dehydrogenase family)